MTNLLISLVLFAIIVGFSVLLARVVRSDGLITDPRPHQSRLPRSHFADPFEPRPRW